MYIYAKKFLDNHNILVFQWYPDVSDLSTVNIQNKLNILSAL